MPRPIPPLPLVPSESGLVVGPPPPRAASSPPSTTFPRERPSSPRAVPWRAVPPHPVFLSGVTGVICGMLFLAIRAIGLGRPFLLLSAKTTPPFLPATTRRAPSREGEGQAGRASFPFFPPPSPDHPPKSSSAFSVAPFFFALVCSYPSSIRTSVASFRTRRHGHPFFFPRRICGMCNFFCFFPRLTRCTPSFLGVNSWRRYSPFPPVELGLCAFFSAFFFPAAFFFFTSPDHRRLPSPFIREKTGRCRGSRPSRVSGRFLSVPDEVVFFSYGEGKVSGW